MANDGRQKGAEGRIRSLPSARRKQPTVSVVGCGNWRVPSDRIGPRVLRALAGRRHPGVELGDVGTSGLGLLDRLHGQELLLLVDAALAGRPGAVRVTSPDFDAPPPLPVSAHQIGPLEVLSIARELYPERLPQKVRIVEVCTEGLAAGEEAQACRRAVAVIERELIAGRVAPRTGTGRASSASRARRCHGNRTEAG